MAATQLDIAREAGVSQTVVSDVLRGRPRGRVSDETRERILAAARRLDYRPNAMAQALRTRHSFQIGYVTAQTEVERFNALGEGAVGSVAQALAEAQYRLLIEVAAGHPEQVAALRAMCAAGLADGGILRAFSPAPDYWELVKALEHPAVVIGQCPDPEIFSVAHDAPGVLRSALAHLASRGRRRVLLASGNGTGDYFRILRSTWEQITPEHGFEVADWRDGLKEREQGAELAALLLEPNAAYDALICLPGRPSVGVSQSLARAGRRSGEDFDLVVIGPASDAWQYEPGTWLYGTNLNTIGRLAAEGIRRLVEGEEPAGPIRVLPELRQL